MENKLEKLLNSLIEKGWNVFGHKDRINAEKCNYIEGNYYNFDNHNISISLRELVSKESGLWQFVCENGMVKKPDIDRGEIHNWDNHNHWLCESSLKDESELEEFLLNNIKVNEKE